MLNIDPKYFNKHLGIDITIEMSDTPYPLHMLSSGEKNRLEQITNKKSIKHYLLGRSALKKILATLRMDTDTSLLKFPHAYLSLTHSGDYAVAIGCKDGSLGLGVDLEMKKNVNPKTASFYLTDLEQSWLNSSKKQSQDPIRLWTVKESLYKAFKNNQNTWFNDYKIDTPSDTNGSAELSIPGEQCSFLYASMEFKKYWLSISKIKKSYTSSINLNKEAA